jgi:hypothetical protein
MMPSSYYLYTAFYRYFWIANVKQIFVYFMYINLTSNGSLFKQILLLLLLTLISLSPLRCIVVVCVVAHCLGGGVAVCIVVRHLCLCLSSALRCVVVSPCSPCHGASLLSALLPVIWVASSSCALSSIMCVVACCLRRCLLSASRWGFCVTLSSATRLRHLRLRCRRPRHQPCHCPCHQPCHQPHHQPCHHHHPCHHPRH